MPKFSTPDPGGSELPPHLSEQLDAFSISRTAHNGDDPVTEVSLNVAEENISVRYIAGNAEEQGETPDALLGELEIELRSVVGSVIDTITISRLTRDSLEKITAAIEGSDVSQPISGLRRSGDLYLLPSKLARILEVAGGQGANVETSLRGITPMSKAQSYDNKFNVAPDGEELHQKHLIAREHQNTLYVVRQGLSFLRHSGAKMIIAPAQEASVVSSIINQRMPEQGIVWIADPDENRADGGNPNDMVWTPQSSEFSNSEKARLALFSSLLNGHTRLDEKVLIFLGPDDSTEIDGYRLRFPGRIFNWLSPENLETLRSFPANQTLTFVLELALRLAVETNEGDSIGATFAVGDYGEIEGHLDAKLRNPFDPQYDSIFDPNLVESIRAYASTDGAMVIDTDGNIHCSGVYFTNSTADIEKREGHGNRHRAAAGLTLHTNAAAVVISESSGDVTCFWKGKPILELSRD